MESTVSNPAYSLWKRQDSLIFSVLLGAITTTIQPILLTAQTSAEIWYLLSETYAKPSRGHVKQIKQQIKDWTKGNKSIDEYFQGLTTRFDHLALLGKPYDHEDQIEFILAGLPEEYKTVVDQIEGRDLAPSLSEVHEKLRNREATIQISTAVPSVPVTTNAVTHWANNNSYNNRRNNNRGSQQTWQQQQHFTPRNQQHTPCGYQGKCQICSVFLPQCSPYQNSMASSSSSYAPWQPRANMVTAPAPYNAANWLLDSDTTHHLTSDLNNLAMHQPYQGGEDVTIADGSGFNITHSGFTTLTTPLRHLALNEVLCVPDVKKNLISVYRLCNTKKVSVEFFPAHFQVKDLSTGTPLLQGKTRNELYEWPVSPHLAYT